MPPTSRFVVSAVFSSATPAVALMAFVTGLDGSGVRCWSARIWAELTTWVATGGLRTVAANVTVAVAPGGSVRFSAKVGGGLPAKVELVPTRMNRTSSNRT